jgi:hypothetical protein
VTPVMNAPASTRWRLSALSRDAAGARLAFGRMHEDSGIERAALHGRIVCVASAGDVAFDLASDRANTVTAIDVNAAQVRYATRRLAGGPVRDGTADRLMALGRRVVGWRDEQLRWFLALSDPDEQVAAWVKLFDTPRFRALLALALRPLGRVVDGRGVPFDRAIRQRLARGFAAHSNGTNPYAPLLLLGAKPAPPAVETPPAGRLELGHADIASYLEELPQASVDGFALSNIGDGAGAAYTRRLAAAVATAAAPGATVVMRSFAEPKTKTEDAAAARDRSFIWGRILIGSPAGLRDW